MSTAFSRRLRKRKLKSDINVVPYIDVMLVLLVIFMVTAPLLNLGIDVDLPQSNAKALDSKEVVVHIAVDKDGNYLVKMPDMEPERVELAILGARLKAMHDTNPRLTVTFSGDVRAPYGAVAQVMNYVSAAGVDRIGLVSKPEEGK